MSTARCATHPEVRAAAACARCGDYACAACLDAAYPELCVRCAARLPHGVAWEDPRAGALPLRFLRTVGQMLARPAVAFPGPARSGRALGFAATAAALLGALAVGVGLSTEPAALEPFATLPGWASLIAVVMLLALIVLLGLAWTAGLALSFALGLAAVGRRVGASKVALRACAYAQAVALATFGVELGVKLAAAPPVHGVAMLIGGALWVGLTARVCQAAGRGLGLRPAPAGAAAIGPAALCGAVAAWRAVRVLETLGSGS